MTAMRKPAPWPGPPPSALGAIDPEAFIPLDPEPPPPPTLRELVADAEQHATGDAARHVAKREAQLQNYLQHRFAVALYECLDVRLPARRAPESIEGQPCAVVDGLTLVGVVRHGQVAALGVLVAGRGVVELGSHPLTTISTRTDLDTREKVVRSNRAALARALRAEPTT